MSAALHPVLTFPASLITSWSLVRPVVHSIVSKSQLSFILQEIPRLWDSESLILKLTKQIKGCYSRWCYNIVSLARASIIEENKYLCKETDLGL